MYYSDLSNWTMANHEQAEADDDDHADLDDDRDLPAEPLERRVELASASGGASRWRNTALRMACTA